MTTMKVEPAKIEPEVEDLISGVEVTTFTELDRCIEISVTPEDATRTQWMRLAETSPALSFWKAPEEDVYSESDGEPL